MNQEKFYVLGVLVLFYYMVTIILVNRVVLYKSLKASGLEDEAVRKKLPYLISVNASLIVSFFILFDTLLNIITYQLDEGTSVVELLSWSSVILFVSVCALLISYLLTLFVMKLGLKINSSILFSILWFCFNAISVVMFNYIYIQISKSDAFTIF
ncbi:hypothetical protein [Gaetbulibacter sp. NE]|uniref:hypothetical protein n=1 Tax=Gaetbulibacter sp. NE TaxID=2982307 RepID=UPI0021D30D74|nr:hypothetical protein [Gaetbulibacter sp. NE]